MDNLTINKAQSPNFTAIYTSKNVINNPAKKAVADTITKILEEKNPLDKHGRNYLERAEDYGYDVFLTHGKQKNSVRMDIIDKLQQDRAKRFGVVPANNKTLVGVYTKPEQFNIDHFNTKYNKMEKETKQNNMLSFGYLGAIILAIGAAILGGISEKNTKPSTSTPPQITIAAKDTLKTDTLKPILKDTFKLGKKIIK